MTNFTWEIKREILQHFPERRKSASAAVSAFLSTGGYVSVFGEVGFVSENERVAEYFLRLAEVFGVHMLVREATRDPKRKKDKLTFFAAGEEARRLYSAASPQAGGMLYLDDEDAALFYLRAAFLGGGSCTLPGGNAKTGYHLEFEFSSRETAEQFCEILATFELIGKLVRRGDKHVVYLKSREEISDFLSVTGAKSALKHFEEVSAAREESNYNNRKGNCDAGNADKAAIASAAQIRAIRALEAAGVLQTLSDPLKETANARIGYPTLFLQELAEQLGISKSCLNHRLRKLMQIYKEKEKQL